MRVDRDLFTRPRQRWPIRSRKSSRAKKKRRGARREERTISEEFAAIAKNAEGLVVLLVPPCYSSPGRGGQLFYWLRVAAHALGATVSVNRAKPPKSERRIIVLVNLRARRPSFSFIRRRHLSRRMSQFPCLLD